MYLHFEQLLDLFDELSSYDFTMSSRGNFNLDNLQPKDYSQWVDIADDYRKALERIANQRYSPMLAEIAKEALLNENT